MDLRYSDSEETFRAGLRSWLAEVVPTLAAEPSNLDWSGRRAYDLDVAAHALRRRVHGDRLAGRGAHQFVVIDPIEGNHHTLPTISTSPSA